MRTLEHILLREPMLADVPELSRMHVASWKIAYRGVIANADLDAITPEDFAKLHSRHLLPQELGGGVADPKVAFLVACEGNVDGVERIAGFGRAGPNRSVSPRGDVLPPSVFERFSAELYGLYLRPEYFGSGLGRMLLGPVVERLRRLGHANLCVWALEHNTIGRRFYERLGGRIVGAAPFTLGACRYTQVAYGWDALPDMHYHK